MLTLKYLVTTSGPKNTVENFKHLKIQHLTTQKIQHLDQYPQNTDFLDLKPKKILPSSLSVNMPCDFCCQWHG